jgi:hypothetical protein
LSNYWCIRCGNRCCAFSTGSPYCFLQPEDVPSAVILFCLSRFSSICCLFPEFDLEGKICLGDMSNQINKHILTFHQNRMWAVISSAIFKIVFSGFLIASKRPSNTWVSVLETNWRLIQPSNRNHQTYTLSALLLTPGSQVNYGTNFESRNW